MQYTYRRPLTDNHNDYAQERDRQTELEEYKVKPEELSSWIYRHLSHETKHKAYNHSRDCHIWYLPSTANRLKLKT